MKFLGFPTDVYKHGTQLLLSLVSTVLACLILGTIFIPVLYELNLISSYEYFNRRFNNSVRTLGSTLFVIKMVREINCRKRNKSTTIIWHLIFFILVNILSSKYLWAVCSFSTSFRFWSQGFNTLHQHCLHFLHFYSESIIKFNDSNRL